MTNLFIERQNDPQLIKILRAGLQSYTHAKRWENTFVVFLIFLGIAYPIFYIYSKDEQLKLILFGCSFGLTIVIQIFYNSLKKDTAKGALLKEEYDITVFGLPRKYTMPTINYADVSTLSVEYCRKKRNVEKTINWYPVNLSEKVPNNIKIAVCQRINTGWGGELRKSYRRSMIGFLCFYSIGLFCLFVTKNVEGKTIFSVLFSIQSFYTYFFTQIRGHSSVIEKRETLSKILDSVILERKEATIPQLRDLQDEIYSTRLEIAKVPDLFYKISKKNIETSFEKDYIERVNYLFEN